MKFGSLFGFLRRPSKHPDTKVSHLEREQVRACEREQRLRELEQEARLIERHLDEPTSGG